MLSVNNKRLIARISINSNHGENYNELSTIW